MREEQEALTRLAERAEEGDALALAQLKRLGDEKMEVWMERAGSRAEAAKAALLEVATGKNLLLRECIQRELDALRQELVGPQAPPLERLLAERVVLCYLQAHHADEIYAQNLGHSTPKAREHLQRRQSRAQEMYLSAIKALAQVRRLHRPALQVNHAEALHAFCLWSEQRGYLAADPLKGLAPFDTTPQTQRRALSAEEITRFLSACTPHLRLLYETAFLSGLRAEELRRLTLDRLDVERSGLRLDASWTKNRQAGFQPLPKSLVERLRAFAESGEADRLYKKAYARHRTPDQAPRGRLLYVPKQTHDAVAEDLKRAGIPQHTPAGKVDFHALRVAFVNLVFEVGEATGKEAQALARHSTPILTFNTYGRVREGRLHQAVERMAQAILPQNHVPSMYRQAVGAQTESATPFDNRGLRSKKLVAGAGFEPTTFGL